MVMKYAWYTDRLIVSCKVWGFHSITAEDWKSPTLCGWVSDSWHFRDLSAAEDEGHAHAVPLPCHAVKGLDDVFPILFTQCGHVWFKHAMPQPCCSERDFSRPQHSMAWHVWISIGHPEIACGQPVCIRLLPATTRSSTRVVIRSIPIH
jgi:hypothetical protein